MVHWVWPWNQLVVLLMFRQFQVCMYILSIIIYHIPLYIYINRCWLLAFTHIYLLHRKFSESAYPWVQSRLSPFLKGDFFQNGGIATPGSRYPLLEISIKSVDWDHCPHQQRCLAASCWSFHFHPASKIMEMRLGPNCTSVLARTWSASPAVWCNGLIHLWSSLSIFIPEY